MADIEYFEDDGGYGASYREGTAQGVNDPPGMGVLVNWVGALLSLGLVVGMAVWAWQLTTRDLSGVPVIRALEGPMRVPPADPGGTQAAHQGLAVNRIAEGAEAAPVPDRLILAPPPVDLDDIEFASTSVATDLPTPAAASADTRALIARLMEQGEPLAAPSTAPEEAAAPAPEVEPQAEPAQGTAIISTSVPGVTRSLRPALRPAVFSAPAAAAPAATGPEELDAASLPEGTRLVQLGAFDTPEIARSEWARLSQRFPDFFADRARVIQEANSGGSAFYRLRAHGFEDLAASRRFCTALMAQNAPCIPVTVR